MMQQSVRRVLAYLVILAVTVQVAFAGLAGDGIAAPSPASSDPFTVICHSGGQTAATADDAGSNLPASGQHSCCDYCVLCHAAPAATAPDDVAFFIPLPRSTRLAVLPAAEPRPARVSHQALPRGPPGVA
jgi:hypothetical protein